jgi:hypothetical protein
MPTRQDQIDSAQLQRLSENSERIAGALERLARAAEQTVFGVTTEDVAKVSAELAKDLRTVQAREAVEGVKLADEDGIACP